MSLFCRLVRNLRRGRFLAETHVGIEDTVAGLSARLAVENAFFAFQPAAWQEGPAGAKNSAASEVLRQAITTLRGIELPAVEDFE